MVLQDVDRTLLLVRAVLVPQLDLGPLVDEDEAKLDAPEVRDGDDHVGFLAGLSTINGSAARQSP